MPDDDLNDDLEPETDPEAEAKNELRGLRAKAKKADEAEAKANALQREILFRDANIDIKSPMATFFMANYQGELSIEAIEAQAKELGIPLKGGEPAPPVNDGPSITDQERQSTQERSDFHSGGIDETGQVATPDPRVVALANAEKVIKDGGTVEDGLAAATKVIFDAARAGDQRVVWNPQRDS